MTDLTKITTPFGLLDKETQEALVAAPLVTVQFWDGPYGWKDHDNSEFFSRNVYRVKPQPRKARVLGWASLHSDGNLSGLYWCREDARKDAARWSGVPVVPLIEWREKAPLPTLPEDEE
jgi:hypothetical protein